MMAIVKKRSGVGVEVCEVPVPTCGEGEILVRVEGASLCGSDLHIYEWSPSYRWLPLPVILGHEFAGQVVEVGEGVSHVRPGDRITASPYISCGNCPRCLGGNGQHCLEMRILGLSADGAFAQYVRLPKNSRLFLLPPEMDAERGALLEPFCVALNAVDRSGIKFGQTAFVLGPGPIGLLTLMLLRSVGVSWVGVAGRASDELRIQRARELGADLLVDVDHEDGIRKVREAMEGLGESGVDLVFEATGDPGSVSQALEMVRPEGKVILMGIHSGDAAVNPTSVVRGRISIIGAYTYEQDTWLRALRYLTVRDLAVESVISHRLPLTAASEGFALARRGEALKVLFRPGGERGVSQ
jgi:threonine dehydrogenase-like Zn-dependent dehydrogenase